MDRNAKRQQSKINGTEMQDGTFITIQNAMTHREKKHKLQPGIYTPTTFNSIYNAILVVIECYLS